MSKINDGGPAFAGGVVDGYGMTRLPAQHGMTLRDYFAAHLPEPHEQEVEMVMDNNRMLNPHNDGPPKPRRLERREVVACLRYRNADAMLAERERGQQ